MELLLYTKDGCHLCDRLEKLLAPLLAKHRVTLTKRNIEDQSAWYEAYWSRIPVLTLGERVLLEGKPSEADVRQVMNEVLSS